MKYNLNNTSPLFYIVVILVCLIGLTVGISLTHVEKPTPIEIMDIEQLTEHVWYIDGRDLSKKNIAEAYELILHQLQRTNEKDVTLTLSPHLVTNLVYGYFIITNCKGTK